MARNQIGPAARAATRALTARALHRSAWQRDGIAVGVALLSGLIALRIGANAFMAIDISARGGTVLWWQCAAGNILVLLAFSSWTAARRLAVVRSAKRHAPWLSRLPSGRRFSRRCTNRALFARAGFVGPLGAGIAMIVAASIFVPNRGFLVLFGTFYCLFAIILPPVVAHTADRLELGEERLEILQLIGLLAILVASPDIAPGDGGVAVVLFRRPIPAIPMQVLGLSIAAGLSPLPVIILMDVYERLGRRAIGRVPRSGLLVWYRRLCAGPWVLVYIIMLPIFLSENLEDASRRWTATAVAVGVLVWLVGVIGKMDQTLEYQWSRPLARRRRLATLAPMVGIHLVLAVIATVPSLCR